jgi:hypothetical protein
MSVSSDSETDIKIEKNNKNIPVSASAPKPKRPLTDKQKSNLQMGIEIMKQKRIDREKREEERAKAVEDAKAKGLPEPPLEEKPVRLRKKEIVDLNPVKLVVSPDPKPRKKRSDTGKKRLVKTPAITREEFEILQRQLIEALPKEKVVEKVVEKPVEKVVERVVEKKITGNELLNKIFQLK